MARTGGSKKNEPFAVRSTPSALGVMKLKPKAKTKSAWKPLDLTENDTSDASASPAPVEMEASQDETEAVPAVSSFHVMAPIRAPLGPPVEMAGSNAQEDKDEVIEEFGHRLAEHVWLRSNTGKHDGELRFVQHPNRDVTAHLWSDEQFEWIQIGLYSRAHKLLEGLITNDKFVEFAGRAGRVAKSLACFTELSKSYPRYHTTRPVAIMPPLSSMQPAGALQPRPPLKAPNISSEAARYASLSSPSESLYDSRLPTLASLTLRDRPTVTPRSLATRSSATPQGLGTPADDPFAADVHISPKTEVPCTLESSGLGMPSVQDDPGKMDFAFRFPSSISTLPRTEAVSSVIETDRKAFFAEQERSRAEKMRQGLTPTERPDRTNTLQPEVHRTSSVGTAHPTSSIFANSRPSLQGIDQGSTVASSSRLATSTSQVAKQAGTQQNAQQTEQIQQMNESRARMLEYLTRIGDEKSSAQMPSQGLHETQQEKGTNKTMPLSGRLVQYEKPASVGSQVSRSALRTSDPEPEYYENRHTSVCNTLGLGGPTPQNFKGPFFQDDMPTQNNPGAHRLTRQTREEELDEWWKSGLRTERHDDFLRTLTRPANSSSTKDDRQVTDRLLVPLYEALASYVRVPGEPLKGRDYFARYAPPADWAIDRSRAGDKSFFGEDWGETPRRIGRDPRFQSHFNLPKYTLFEEQHEDSALRFQQGFRGSQAGSAYAPSSFYARNFG